MPFVLIITAQSRLPDLHGAVGLECLLVVLGLNMCYRVLEDCWL